MKRILDWAIAVAAAIASWYLIEFLKDKEIMRYIVSFLITFSPVLIGLAVFFICWVIRDYRKIRKQVYNTQELVNKVKNEIFSQISKRLDYMKQNLKHDETKSEIQKIIDEVYKTLI